MSTGLTIGEFAALTHLSIRTLRHYHETGVLEPASVDPFTGYRHYSPDQIPPAQVIHRLRQLDLPLPEIKAILATDDADRRAELIAGHLSRLESELDRTRAAVVALQRLLHPDTEALAIELRLVPERTVAAVSATVRREDVNAWYDAAMRDLDAAVHPGMRHRPPAGRYANELFTEGTGEVMVFYPVHGIDSVLGTTGRVELTSLPAIELAVAVHSGNHDAITETYGRVGQWVVDHALVVAGPVHETYLVGPRDTDAETQWRTEIGWPIFRIG